MKSKSYVCVKCGFKLNAIDEGKCTVVCPCEHCNSGRKKIMRDLRVYLNLVNEKLKAYIKLEN